MKQYQQLNAEGNTFKIGVTSIPANNSNRHYRQMQAEIAAGEAEVLPYVPPPPAPKSITLDDLITELEASDPTLRAKLQARADSRGAN